MIISEKGSFHLPLKTHVEINKKQDGKLAIVKHIR
jgi:hypothetical protein